MVTHSIVSNILLENIDNTAALFVFPTDVAASRWADNLLRLRSLRLREAGTIPMDKFIAWDTFKQNSIRSKVKNRKSIPSVLRKMFISALIRENAEKAVAPPGVAIFSSLIRPEWAGQADSFAGWLTGILPQLGVWFKKTTGLPIARVADSAALQIADSFSGYGSVSDDDRDLFTLAVRYTQFLEERGLFEPAWETPPFEDTGKKCFIFFPESLSDFSEYKELLEASEHVKTIYASETEQQSHSIFFYTNSRSEITEAALYILALHKNQNIPWDSISVSIPDDEYYGPYLFREFNNRNIPYIKQSGKPLAQYPVGQFFAALTGCTSADFAFASIKELLLNPHLPWKNGDTIQALIEFGIKNNCISSWVETEDGKETALNVWEDAFEHPFGSFNAQIRRFFEDLKRRVNAICRAESFAEVRKQYFIFREHFFDMENCLEETDLVLSRCISELMYLVEIEKSFPDVQVPNPYAFFSGYLEEVNYLAQQSASGVAILPYRTAAPAPFDCHIVLGASQGSLSAVFSPLAFLSKSRRDKLGIADNDASLAFIRLHRLNSRLPAAFFCSEQTFSGYTIPHSALGAPEKPRQRFGDDPDFSGQFAQDLYREESKFYATLEGAPPAEIHHNQKQGFAAWQTRRNQPAGVNNTPTATTVLPQDHPLLQKIRQRFGNYENEFKDKLSVSSSSLAPYFECPLLWIFSRVFNLENVAIETGLMASNITGDVYHAILSLYLNEFKNSGVTISEQLNIGLLDEKIETVFASFPFLPGKEYQEMSMLSARLLQAEKQLFFSRLAEFLAKFNEYFAGFRVIATEEHYSSPRDIYFLNGRIDCILEATHNSPTTTLAIVDFKTKYKKERGSIDFQLPLYLRLAEEVYKKDVDTALFFSIIDAKPFALFDNTQEKNGIMTEFDQRAAQFAQEISDGTFSFSPSHQEQCRQCEYNKVCRTLYKVCQGKINGT